MKITFLGTSHGVPGADRYCSSALVECGDNAYLIDGGAPVADLLIRYGVPYEKLKAVFTTHIHSDHTIGLLHLMSLSSWKFKESSYDLYLTEQLDRNENGKSQRNYRLHARAAHTPEMALAYEIKCPKCGNTLKQIARQRTLTDLGLYTCKCCNK